MKADFVDNSSIRDISGDFYLQADNIVVTSWLPPEWVEQTGIVSGKISLNSWFSVIESQPVDAYVELLPSELKWQNQVEHLLQIEQGIFKLTPSSDGNGWQVMGIHFE